MIAERVCYVPTEAPYEVSVFEAFSVDAEIQFRSTMRVAGFQRANNGEAKMARTQRSGKRMIASDARRHGCGPHIEASTVERDVL